jgi:hypothetical protein
MAIYGLNGRTVLYGVVLLAFCMGSHVVGNTHPLFSDDGSVGNPADGRGVIPPSGDPSWVQYRPVQLSSAVTVGEGLATGDQLVFALFDDTTYSADIDRISRNTNGTVSVRGRITGYPMGTILISTTDGRSLASIDIPELNQHCMIRSPSDTAVHFLAAVDMAKLKPLEDGPPLIPPVRRQPEPIAPPSDGVEAYGPLDTAIIHVMIVYTPAARAWANSDGGGIGNVIAQAMEKGQLALDNSKTFVDLRLTVSREVDYTESGDSGKDLERLTNPADGFMDNVAGLRDKFKADLVCLYASVEDVGGIGWLLTSASGDPDLGYCLNRVQQAGWTYTQIHEMGHNMGCHHHKAQNFQPGPGLFDYSAGWRWIGNDGNRYCSVMTYESGQYFSDGQDHTRVAYFSNPSLSYQGKATGHVTNGDNARTIREVKHVIAAYRSNKIPNTPTLISPENGATGVILIPTLKASAYSDPDGDNHANSRWQVDTDSDFSSPEWDTGDTYAASTEYVLPVRMESSTKYYWRVRYKDSWGEWSKWSSSRFFTTQMLYSGGTGTEADPFRIGTVADWVGLTRSPDDWTRHFILMTDLDFTGVALTPVAADTSPASTFQGIPFKGDLNGDHHILRHASILLPNQDYVGLFGYVGEGGQIRNLGVTQLAVSGGKNVGGLAGWNERATLTCCYVMGTVAGTETTGGLVGGNWVGKIRNCYAGGSVTGTQYVGGLVGGNLYYGELNFCYSSGAVQGQSLVGGLTGWDWRGFVTGCVWDVQASGQASSACGTGKTTAEMKTPTAFAAEGWDLVGEEANGMADLWRVCADGTGYPRLSWEYAKPGDFACPNGVGVEDLVYLAGRWLANTPETIGVADADGNGKVDLYDFAIMAAEWMK